MNGFEVNKGKRVMEIHKALTLLLAIALVAIFIVGLVNFDLFMLIWARVLVATVIIGVVVTMVKSLFHS